MHHIRDGGVIVVDRFVLHLMTPLTQSGSCGVHIAEVPFPLLRAKAIGIDVIIRTHLHEINRPALPGGGSLFLEGGKGVGQVALWLESVTAVEVGLAALGTRGPWDQGELIDGPQFLLGPLMRLIRPCLNLAGRANKPTPQLATYTSLFALLVSL